MVALKASTQLSTWRWIGEFPKIGIRPVIGGRRSDIRESLEDQTMGMAHR
jgi:L-fucose/D-arabinose isomerase